MFDFLNPAIKNIPPEQAALLRALGGEVNKYVVMDQLGAAALDRVSGKHDFDEQERRLNLMLKKKQLGMDIDDDEYESILNKKKIGNAGVASLMNSVPKHAILRATYKNAYAIKDDLPSILDTFKGGLGHATGSSPKSANFVRDAVRFVGKR